MGDRRDDSNGVGRLKHCRRRVSPRESAAVRFACRTSSDLKHARRSSALQRSKYLEFERKAVDAAPNQSLAPDTSKGLTPNETRAVAKSARALASPAVRTVALPQATTHHDHSRPEQEAREQRQHPWSQRGDTNSRTSEVGIDNGHDSTSRAVPRNDGFEDSSATEVRLVVYDDAPGYQRIRRDIDAPDRGGFKAVGAAA